MKSKDKYRATILLEPVNNFIKAVPNKSKLINYLIIKEFGNDAGISKEEQKEERLKKITKAIDLIENEASVVLNSID